MLYHGHVEPVEFTVEMMGLDGLKQQLVFSPNEKNGIATLFFDCTSLYPDDLISKNKIRSFDAINKVLNISEYMNYLRYHMLFITMEEFIKSPPNIFGNVRDITQVEIHPCMFIPDFISLDGSSDVIYQYGDFLDMYLERSSQALRYVSMKSSIGFNPVIKIRGISDPILI